MPVFSVHLRDANANGDGSDQEESEDQGHLEIVPPFV